MNAADLYTATAFITVPVCVGIVALREHAGWSIIGFIALGAICGFAIAFVVRRLAYSILHFGIRWNADEGWLFWPIVVAYLLLPLVVLMTGGVLACFATKYLIQAIS